jgi:hypothetical protein
MKRCPYCGKGLYWGNGWGWNNWGPGWGHHHNWWW